MSSTTPRNSSSSFRNSVASIKTMAKEHHRSVNDAYEALYGPVYTKRPSVASANSSSSANKRQSRLSSAWTEVKQKAREHHEAVNSAYSSLYGFQGPQHKA